MPNTFGGMGIRTQDLLLITKWLKEYFNPKKYTI